MQQNHIKKRLIIEKHPVKTSSYGNRCNTSRISGKSNYRSKTFMETELVLSEGPKRRRTQIRTAKSKLFTAQTSKVLKAIIV